WIIGRPETVVCDDAVPAAPSGSMDPCDGDVVEESSYNSDGRPLTREAFGRLQYTLTYHADGTLWRYKDGNNNTTSLTNWYRGVPRHISFPGSASKTATVNPTGTIDSTTDEAGFTTSYLYDAVGRMTKIT